MLAARITLRHFAVSSAMCCRNAAGELVKVDLEQRTTRGRKKPLESYTVDFPELLENGEPPCDLIYEEYHIRRTAGETVTPRDYYQRFPRSADALRRSPEQRLGRPGSEWPS